LFVGFSKYEEECWELLPQLLILLGFENTFKGGRGPSWEGEGAG